MAKSCPPGVICLENFTFFMFFILIILFSVLLFQYHSKHPLIRPGNQVSQQAVDTSQPVIIEPTNSLMPNNYIDIRRPMDMFEDPYLPPVKYPGLVSEGTTIVERGVPINVRTQGAPGPIQQMGILTRSTPGPGGPSILPLMGRRMITNRDRWQYYTVSDTNINLRLPVSKGGRSCTSDIGCDEIYDGDTVYVEGYNAPFSATIYESASPRYIPFI